MPFLLEAQLLENAKLDLGGEERQADIHAVLLAPRRLGEISQGARDGADVHFRVAGGTFPDQRDEPALHEPLAAHALPEGDSGARLLSTSTAGGRIDGDPDAEASVARGNGEELRIGVDVEKNGVLPDGVPSIFTTSFLDNLVELGP